MKPLPTNIGANPKKLALLGGIVLVGLPLVYWANSGSNGPPQAAPSPGAAVALNATPEAPPPKSSSGVSPGPAASGAKQTRGKSGRTVEDFRPSIKVPEGVDISRVDPRLKTELLARLRALPSEGGTRSVFEFYTPPAPPPPQVQVIKPVQVTTVALPPGPVTPPGPPPTPPIPIKLYAFAGPAGSKTRRAGFLDGEDIFVVSENDVIRNRYRIVRIGVLDAEVEDTVTKKRETIKIVPELDQ
jgi:hypothetical protein